MKVAFSTQDKQRVDWVGKQLVVNPGAAGARRFDLEPSVARLRVTDGRAEVTLIALAGD
jgi:predicted phosphodiesterase